jgi:hypothetical protein
VLVVGVGDDGGADVSEGLERGPDVGVELHGRRHLEEEVHVRASVRGDLELPQHARQDRPLDLPEGPERPRLRGLEVEIDPGAQEIVGGDGPAVVRHDAPGNQPQVLVAHERAVRRTSRP